jgi:hypothetical protein
VCVCVFSRIALVCGLAKVCLNEEVLRTLLQVLFPLYLTPLTLLSIVRAFLIEEQKIVKRLTKAAATGVAKK